MDKAGVPLNGPKPGMVPPNYKAAHPEDGGVGDEEGYLAPVGQNRSTKQVRSTVPNPAKHPFRMPPVDGKGGEGEVGGEK